MQQMIVINDQEVKFEVAENEVFTTSLDVAKVFNKNHKHIIAKIDEYSDEIKHRTKIRPISYLDKYGREQKAYELSRDAFSFLVMGFTGREADKWKLDFIDAFNKMESYIRNNHIPPRPDTRLLSPMELMELQFQAHKELVSTVDDIKQDLTALKDTSALTAKDCYMYQKAVEQKVWETIDKLNLDADIYKPKLFPAIHNAIKKIYQVGSYKDLPHFRVEELLADVRSLTPSIKMN
jgi:Rha family phage regulatory protein